MTTESTTSALDQVLIQAEQRIVALEVRLARLEQTPGPKMSPMEEVSSRRGLFKLAGAVATGAIASTMFSASPAAASTTGPYVGLGQAEVTSADTGIIRTNASGGGIAFSATNTSTTGVADGIKGISNGSITSAGVNGESSSGFGVYGSSSSGYSLYAAGAGRIGMTSHLAAGPPQRGSYATGDIISDDSGNTWTCVVAGAPGAWRKLGGPNAAGQLHLLSSPLRAYDSRPGEPAANGGEGPLSSNGNSSDPARRYISLSVGRNGNGDLRPAAPIGSIGALITLTTVSTQAVGYLTVQAAGLPWSRTSSSNWGSTGQSVAGTLTVALNASSAIDVFCPLNSTQFLIDVAGYYR